MSVRLLDVFFSRYAPGHDKGPKKKHFDAVQRHIEANGWRCVDLVQVYKNGDMANESEEGEEREEPILFCREASLCGTAVKVQYYSLKDNQGKGRESTPNIFAVIVIPIGTLQKLRM